MLLFCFLAEEEFAVIEEEEVLSSFLRLVPEEAGGLKRDLVPSGVELGLNFGLGLAPPTEDVRSKI